MTEHGPIAEHRIPSLLSIAFEPGDRVELVACADELTRLEPGARGTVDVVDALGTVHVTWDDGTKLGLIFGQDSWKGVDE